MPNATVDRAPTQCLARRLAEPAAPVRARPASRNRGSRTGASTDRRRSRQARPASRAGRFAQAVPSRAQRQPRGDRASAMPDCIDAWRTTVEAASERNEMAWTQRLQAARRLLPAPPAGSTARLEVRVRGLTDIDHQRLGRHRAPVRMSQAVSACRPATDAHRPRALRPWLPTRPTPRSMLARSVGGPPSRPRSPVQAGTGQARARRRDGSRGVGGLRGLAEELSLADRARGRPPVGQATFFRSVTP